MMPPVKFSLRPLCLLMLLALTGCDRPAPSAQQAPDTSVTVETIKPQPLSLVTELNGRLVAPRVAEVRARVAGVLLQRVYREGSQVKQGDVLRYQQGLDEYLTQLDSQRTLYQAENTLIDARLQLALSQINLFKSLGGGWSRDRP